LDNVLSTDDVCLNITFLQGVVYIVIYMMMFITGFHHCLQLFV